MYYLTIHQELFYILAPGGTVYYSCTRATEATRPGTVSDPTEERKPGIVGEGALLKGNFR